MEAAIPSEHPGAARAGANKLEIKVTNLWPNRLIGDEQLEPDREWTATRNVAAWPQWLLDGKPSPSGESLSPPPQALEEDDALLRSGLIGPVTLRVVQQIPLGNTSLSHHAEMKDRMNSMLTKLTPVLWLALLATICQAAEPAADVFVYGGTSGGVIAAVQAARMGKSVVLIEPGKHLGGMSSGGLGMTDNGSTETIGGLSREFYQRVYRTYTEPASWKHARARTTSAWLPKIWGVDGPRMEEIKAQFIFEPHAAERGLQRHGARGRRAGRVRRAARSEERRAQGRRDASRASSWRAAASSPRRSSSTRATKAT